MENLDIRLMIDASGLKFNKVAEKMGVSDDWFYAAMRTPLSPANRERVLKALREMGVQERNIFLDAANQLENITALDGEIDYGKRSKKQIKELDDAIDLAIDLLRKEGARK